MSVTPHLTRSAQGELAWLGDDRRPGGVTLAFTERTGGCSLPPYTSLNLGAACGDAGEAVAENRFRLLAALDCAELAERLVNPKQVHGSQVVVIDRASAEAVEEAQQCAREGADAVVCAVPDVPVLLCFADCVPVVLVADGGFAVVHSGWKGTMARIAAKATAELCQVTKCTPAEVIAYVGPHIRVEDYEVSPELAEQFVQEFGAGVATSDHHVDLGLAVARALQDAGVQPASLLDACPSTASCTSRFYSYRAEGGQCGRHGAFAVMRSDREGVA